MEEVKIRNFIKEHGSEPFPNYRTVSVDEADRIRWELQNKLEMAPNSLPLDLVREVRDKSLVIPDFDAEGEDFDFNSVLIRAGITPCTRLFINWHRFDQIDEMDVEDLTKYFDDIWYPSVDHIDIFDDSLSWIVSIGYSGEVSILQFPS